MTSKTHWKKRFTDRVRQFGWWAACAQIVRAIGRPLLRVDRELVLGLGKRPGDARGQSQGVRALTLEEVEAAGRRGDIASEQEDTLRAALAKGHLGVAIQVDDRLAGYAFVQPKGTYAFDRTGRFRIPRGVMVFKNLFVLPAFRGRSLGKMLNWARIAMIPKDHVPVAFVMWENRYAIRNLKLCGFEELFLVNRRTWCQRWTTQRIQLRHDCHLTRLLLQGFEASSSPDEAGVQAGDCPCV